MSTETESLGDKSVIKIIEDVASLEEKKEGLANKLKELLVENNIFKDQMEFRLEPSIYADLKKQQRDVGRNCQAVQLEMGRLGKQIKKLNGEMGKIEDVAGKRIAFSMEQRHLQWESFFVEVARDYLSGHEFEIIAKQATSKLEIRR